MYFRTFPLAVRRHLARTAFDVKKKSPGMFIFLQSIFKAEVINMFIASSR
jgi:hypothetical protein